MGHIKEYVDRAIQTEVDQIPSPYADPAVVLAAPLVARRGLLSEGHTGDHNSIPPSSPLGSDSAFPAPQSPISPILAPLVSRRLSKRKYTRGDIMKRRIVSMPENKNQGSSSLSQSHGKRVVSMPDRIRPVLEPSMELFQSPSIGTGDSFGSYSERSDRIHVFRAPSDVPQTPSPPSSPESLLIIAAGTQLPEGFLRRKCSPEPLIEEDEDWITWANSPPRPIPALHGPLSLPYARCPSGAEGTIIEEPDNVAQMIWGLGPDDQPHNQVRAEGLSSYPDNPQNVPSHGPSQIPPRLQKKRVLASQQVPKSFRTQASAHTGHVKQSFTRTQRQARDDNGPSLSQHSPDIETQQDIASGFSWNEAQSMSISVEMPDNLVNDTNAFSVDNNCILELQLARLRRALRTSFVDVDSYSTYSERLEPVIPATLASGLPQSYPRIFVEPRPNESVGSITRRSSEVVQQYRQQQLYSQALREQKLKVQNFLPTPPSSSSPQWSSHFSPYLTYCSTFSPELVGSTEHPVLVSPQKYRSGPNASQYLPHVYERNEHDNVNNFDTNTSSTKTPQIMPTVNPTASLGQGSSSSSTLARYIKQLQALSPVAHLSPLQQVSASNVPLDPLPAVPTPPSPESPQTLSRGSSHNARSAAPMRGLQRRLSSVPEEDSALVELSISASSPRLQNQTTTDSIPPSHDGTTGHRVRYLEGTILDVAQKSAIPDLPEVVGTPSIAFYHDTSPVKVRLPVTREHNIPGQANGHHGQNKGHQHGHRKKHRYKKIRVPTTTNEQAPTRGLVG